MLETTLAILREGWGVMLLRGALVTLGISICGMLLGMLVGIIGASIRLSSYRLAGFAISVYTTVVRSIPELLIIYLLFFGSINTASDLAFELDLDSLMDRWFPALVGIAAITLISGSYQVEVFRGALQAIHKGQIEAAEAVGMTHVKRLRRVVIPQMFWYALPAMNNVWQTALKDTALISLVGLVEIMRAAVLGAAATRESLILYLLAGALYFVIAVLSQVVFVLAERYFGRGMQAA